MIGALTCLRREIVAHARMWVGLTVAFLLGFHLLQLAILMLRFETFPNYLTIHDWPSNLARIVRMTPSVADMIPIMFDEWLVEIGAMNYAFGRGIAEWSFVLIPGKVAVALVISVLVATNLVLLRASWKRCALPARLGASVVAAGGTLLTSVTATTVTWVVCCAAPTWVVSLAVLGVGVSTALALQPLGGWLSLIGFLLLAGTAMTLARQLSRPSFRAAAPPVMLMPTQIARVPS